LLLVGSFEVRIEISTALTLLESALSMRTALMLSATVTGTTELLMTMLTMVTAVLALWMTIG
jgi:hypothetical protein